MRKRIQNTMNLLAEFSVPLISGVLCALFWANLDHTGFHHFVDDPIFGESFKVFGHVVDFHFLVNDVFMIFFFGIAAVEITEAMLPGGALNPLKKAVNPLLGTLGGVMGPIVVFVALAHILDHTEALRGWGIPTATDIALAWLVARAVFGNRHPAVSFLLLLAIADDAIGLVIIALFYPDPNFPVEVQWLLLTLLGMGAAYALRRLQVKSIWPYLAAGGVLAWIGLMKAHLHPALALVFIVPFMPHAERGHEELFEEEPKEHSTLASFEHTFKGFVDFGLFGFGLANAGVELGGINDLTWMVFGGLLIGKTLGIGLFSTVAEKLGFPLPDGMNHKTLYLAGMVGAVGLTVALFVAGQAFTDPVMQGAAKMGAVFSGLIAFPVIVLGRLLKVKRIN